MDITQKQTSSSPVDFYTKVKVVYGSISMLIGISIFIGFQYHDRNVAIWGLASGVVTGLVLLVHHWYIRNLAKGLHKERIPPNWWMFIGCLIQLSDLCGFAVYWFLGRGPLFYSTSHFVGPVWCFFMTWKWGLILLLSPRRCRNTVDHIYTVLPVSEKY